MKKAITVGILFFCLASIASAQTKTKNELLQNSAGNQLTLGAPVTVTNNTILFPGTLGLQGALLYISSTAASVGTTTWLNPGTNGFILSLSGGVPVWSNPATVLGGAFWSLNGSTGITSANFLGTTDTNTLIIKTNNLYRLSVVGGATNTGNVGIGTTTATTTTASAAIGDKLTILGGDLSFNSETNSAITRSILFRGTASAGNFRIGADGGDIFWQGGGAQNLQMGCYWRIDLLGQRQSGGFPAFSAQATDCHIYAPLIQPTIPGFILRGAVSQSADLMQWQNSASTILSSISSSGEMYSNTFRVNITSANPPFAEGRVFYDSAEHALTYYNEDNTDHVNIGQEDIIRVRNITGSSIPLGSAVYITGFDAATQLSTIALAKADQLNTADAIGLTQSIIANNSTGYVLSFGTIDNFNTLGYTAGAALYVSATTAGAITPVRPGQPNFTYPIAFVENAATLGSVMVRAGNLRQGAMTPGAIAFGGSDGYIGESPAKLFFDSVNQRLGVGTNTPATGFDVNGDLSTRSHGVTIAAGVNNNVAIGGFSSIILTGASAAYSITGFTNTADGKELQLFNLTPYPMTLVHQSTSSTAGNRIFNPTNNDLTIADSGMITLSYNATLNTWVVRNSSGGMSGTNGTVWLRQKSDVSITNSTTFQAITDLDFEMEANATYQIHTVLLDSGVGASYFTAVGVLPTGATVSGFVSTGEGGSTAPDYDIIRNGIVTNGSGLATLSGKAGFSVADFVVHTGSTAGLSRLMWGMLTTSALKTIWLFKDSFSIIKRVE